MSDISEMIQLVIKFRTIKTFLKDERGSFSIEAVIWMPIFAALLAVVMNVSLVFFNKSQVLRVVQDGNRMFSLGRVDSSDDVANYIRSEIGYMSEGLVINSDVNNGLIKTRVQIPAVDLMPMNFMRGSFKTTLITFSAQQIIEY